MRGAKYLVVDRHSEAHWSEAESTCITVDKSKLLEWMEYLIDNIYIKVGNRVYRQIVGIPMGTDCVPQLANLSLFHFEYSYMQGLMKENLHEAKKVSDTMRYIHDLL